VPRLPRGKEVSDWKPVDSGLTLGMRSLCLSSLEAEPHRLNDDARAGRSQLETGKTGLMLYLPETDSDTMPRICLDISQQSGREADWAIFLFAEPPLSDATALPSRVAVATARVGRCDAPLRLAARTRCAHNPR